MYMRIYVYIQYKYAYINSCLIYIAMHSNALPYPIKNYRGLSLNNRGERWAYVHFIVGAANYPIIYP